MLTRVTSLTSVPTLSPPPPQAPGFIRSLETFAPPGVHLIYTFPNFESCARIDLKKVLARWKRVTVLPLPIRASPMQVRRGCGRGWARWATGVGKGERGACEAQRVGGRAWLEEVTRWRGRVSSGRREDGAGQFGDDFGDKRSEMGVCWRRP